jgi:hypothetical protein
MHGENEIGEGSFLSGTRIALASGDDAAEMSVDELKSGDHVATLGSVSPTRPVLSGTQRRVDHSMHALPVLVTPIRFAADSLGSGMPQRAPLLPAEALVLIRDLASPALVPAGALLNGTSIARAPPATPLNWFALELDAHDVVLAENLPVATVRGPNTDAPDHLQARCARLLLPGAELEALRVRLAGPSEGRGGQAMAEIAGDDRRSG